MILLLLLILCSSHLCAIIIEGVSFECVKMIADRHPSYEHRPDQDKLKKQLAIVNAFLQNKTPQNTVVLAEEISHSLANLCIKPHEACILNDMRILANRHGLKYENIDLRAATLAAGNVIKRYPKKRPINPSLSFGPTEDSLKMPLFVTLDDLLGEKERYIDSIKERFSWSDDEQKRSDRLSQALLNTLQGWDVDTTVRTFCSKTSPEVQQKVYDQMGNMSTYLFDNYAKKTVMNYSLDHTVLLAAGSEHIQNIKDQLATDRGWNDYRIHYNGGVLTDYNLKSTLGTLTWWDHTKNCLGYTG